MDQGEVTVSEVPTHRKKEGEVLLEVENLNVEFHTDAGVVKAVQDMSFTLHAKETFAIIGESGSGKSVTAQAIMGIVPSPPGVVTVDAIRFRGSNLDDLRESDRRKVRGQEIAMIFQDPLTSLNPVFTVGDQIGEMFRVHRDASKSESRELAIDLMEQVRIPEARRRVGDYPHQFSGGMRQRVMIAMALALDPAVIIADEPTTALDVTVQAQIMELLGELQEEHNMGLVLITHDLGVVASVADTVQLMYAGKTVERAEADEFYEAHAHPYAEGLMDSIPSLIGGKSRLDPIEGLPPSLIKLPSGCSFHPRCPYAIERCVTEIPELRTIDSYGGIVACHRAEEVREQILEGVPSV